MLLRLLIADIAVDFVDVPRRSLRIRILWQTRAVSELEVGPLAHRASRDMGPVPWRLVKTTNPDVNKAAG